MTEHVHGCLTCMPGMVPDFDPADLRYHSGARCGSERFGAVLVDGVDVGYTDGVMAGPEGWALVVGAPDEAHRCPCGDLRTCVEPRFGAVTIQHTGTMTLAPSSHAPGYIERPDGTRVVVPQLDVT